MNKNIYKNDRPVLTIENAGGKDLGHCYSVHFSRITSLYPMTKKTMQYLWDAGFIGSGQGYSAEFLTHESKRVPLPEIADWQHPVIPTAMDEVPCVEVDYEGNVIGPGINSYTKEEYKPTKIGYYVYLVEARCDSSD